MLPEWGISGEVIQNLRYRNCPLRQVIPHCGRLVVCDLLLGTTRKVQKCLKIVIAISACSVKTCKKMIWLCFTKIVIPPSLFILIWALILYDIFLLRVQQYLIFACQCYQKKLLNPFIFKKHSCKIFYVVLFVMN